MLSSRRVARLLALFACFGFFVWLTTAGGIRLIESAKLGKPTTNLTYARVVKGRLPELSPGASQPGTYRVGLLGDSIMVSYPQGRQVADRVQSAVAKLTRGAPPVRVHSLAAQGAGPFDYYFMADDIAAAEPDLVVISLTLGHLAEAWRGAYSRPELAGFIRPDRVWEALRLPLHRVGLTADRLFFYVGVVRLGGYEAWRNLALQQARVGRARHRLESRFSLSEGESPEQTFRDAVDQNKLDTLFVPGYQRFRLLGLKEHFGAAMRGVEADLPVLQVLGATIRAFGRSGIPTLVFICPANLEYMASLGMVDEEGLGRTLAAIRREVVASGGEFADFHAALPDRAFRDAAGHLTHQGEFDGPARLAELVAPSIANRARSRVEATD